MAVHAKAEKRLRATVMRGYRTGVAADPDAVSLARFLERNAPVLAFTGAGVSTASGLPDFRSPGGLWERLDPMVDGHVDMLARDPGRVWQCWAEPLVGARIMHNPHAALARLERVASSGVSSRRTSTACTTPPEATPSRCTVTCAPRAASAAAPRRR